MASRLPFAHRAPRERWVWIRCAVTVCALAGALAVGQGSAQAALRHNYLSSFGLFGGTSSIAVDEATGDVYIEAGSTIYKYNAAGEPAEFSALKSDSITNGSLGTIGHPGEIAVDNSCFLRKLSGPACESAAPANGDLYADTEDGLLIFGADGSLLGELKTGAQAACGVAVDPDGRVYVGHEAHQYNVTTSIGMYVPTANPLTSGDYTASLQGLSDEGNGGKASGNGGEACNLVADGKGDVYSLASYYDGPVIQYPASQFGLQQAIGRQVAGEGLTLAVDPSDEDLYVNTEHSVTQYSLSGEPLDTFGVEGAGEIGSASSGVAVNGTSGDIYVADSVDGSVSVFGPAVVVPDVSTAEPSGFTESGSTLTGSVDPDGLPVTGCEFEYGPETSYGQTVPCALMPGSGSAAVTVSATVSGLAALQHYHYRLVATNANGPSYGADEAFTVPVKAVVGGESVSDIAGESATFSALIDPGGGRTTYRFEYGSSASYGSNVPIGEAEVGAGVSAVSVSVRAQGLLPGRLYHFRAVASNPLGVVVGPDEVFSTQSAGTEFALPDGREYELVSPPNKDGGEVGGMASYSGGGIVQASEAGAAVTYLATTPFETATPANTSGTQYVSRRGAAGWSTENIMPPEISPGISINDGGEYRAFTADLSGGVVEPFIEGKPSRLSAEAPEGAEEPYVRSDGVSGFQPLVTSQALNAGGSSTKFIAGTPNLGHAVLSSTAALVPGAVGGVENLFEWTRGSGLRLIAAEAGAQLGSSRNVRHAISEDGSHVIWSTKAGIDDSDTVSGETAHIAGPESIFQIASNDGSRVFFTHGGQLEEFDVTTDKTIGLTAGEADAHVQGVVGASEDGSYVYFVALGRLAAGAVSGEDNLYGLHYAGTAWEPAKLVATLSGADSPDWDTEFLPGLTARVSPNGRFLTFISVASLTGYDNADVNGGEPDAEVYLYDASSGGLRCVSCNPTGARPEGEFDGRGGLAINLLSGSAWVGHRIAGMIPGWTPMTAFASTYQSRYLSDAGRLFFDSPEALVPQDTNGKEDVYEYEPDGVGSCQLEAGCVALISNGIGSSDSMFVDASVTGEDVFFVTKEPLVAQDVDQAQDMYDAHACSAQVPCFATPPVPPPACTSGDACKPGPTPQPATFGAPASATFSGLGNLVRATSKATGETKRAKAKKRRKRKAKPRRRKRRRHSAQRVGRAGRSTADGVRPAGRGAEGRSEDVRR
jgi:hypothetical protein